MAPRSPKKRRSTATRARKSRGDRGKRARAPKARVVKKKRKPKPKPKPKPVKRRKRKGAISPPPKRKPAKAPKRKPAKRKKASKAKRSAAKRKKLLKRLADMRVDRMERESDQPLGWTERRAELRENDSGVWQRIINEYDPKARDALRHAELERLELDFATKDELYDFMAWWSEQSDIDIGDLYEMYLGYEEGEG